MDQVTQEIFGQIEIVSPISAYDLTIALASSTLLTLAIAKLYATTHGGYSYSKTFLQAIVLVGVTVSLIMVIIGSDIARAFALVGAMSIVRFRTPLKDARDLVFVFAAIAVGMACGVQFHAFAAIFTVFLFALVLGFHYLGFGELANSGYVVKLRIDGAMRPDGPDPGRALQALLGRLGQPQRPGGPGRGGDLRDRAEERRHLRQAGATPELGGRAAVDQHSGG